MEIIENYQKLVTDGIEEHLLTNQPQELYDPINYILNLGGKRLRPVMVLMAADLFGGNLQTALKPALAIEYFHNFTLMHDDIMDCAPLRRGKATVHTKYNTNTAILSGDALMIKSYQLFEDLPADLFKSVVQLFSETAAQICDGQQYDMNFETQKEVNFDDYLAMITLKTGVMVAASFKIGAIIGGASEQDANKIYEFGRNLGIAFQIKDDYLDVFGKEEFGKIHAGDIIENKKTVLYFSALKNATPEQKKELEFWFNIKTENIDKVYAVEKIFNQLQVNQDVLKMMYEYNNLALESLKQISIDESKKQPLYNLSNHLLDRKT